ncbi:hypothetical protein [Streptomyces sp. NBC_01618]|uniref:hypothetical protein n=1 Tax=Streptomyces sp. NBC_01618 TaxID=2975900 RepID=UPI00386CFCDE|nr:hypothetical protein OH735_00760 [Streptomyces sp. NBC_01618]
MAQITRTDLYRLLDSAPRRRADAPDGIRMLYDGAAMAVSTVGGPADAVTSAGTRHATAAWELMAHSASLSTVRAWLRLMEGDPLIDVSPFWGGDPVCVVFTAAEGCELLSVC